MRSLVLVTVMGCSFATSGPPARYDGSAEPDCTTSRALPVLDASGAIAAGVIGIPPIVQSWGEGCDANADCHDDWAGTARSIGLLFVTVGVLYTLAAYTGFSNVNACEKAIRLHQRAASSVAP